MSRKFGLGKGLDSLLPTEAPVEKPAAAVKLSDKISINQLKPNKEQPRKYFDETRLLELTESIKVHGVIQSTVQGMAPSGHISQASLFVYAAVPEEVGK